MLALADRISAQVRQNSRPLAARGEQSRALAVREEESRYSADVWLQQYLMPAMEQFAYGGNRYSLNLTNSAVNIHEIANSLPGYTAAVQACPPAFAAQLVRAAVISGARFTFRTRRSSGKPLKTFGTAALGPLERPWTNATTGELLARMEWHAGLAGNAYVTNRSKDRLRVLRPDWVALVYGSHQDPEQAAYALDGELIGYVYAIGGLVSTGESLAPVMGQTMYTLLPHEVAHWSPIPDPEASGIGMSWLTPAVRDMQADRAATEHKLRFFSQGATPNLVVKGITAATREKFLEIVDMLEERHAGVANAFKTLYLTAGADATVVGSNFKDMDLKNIQGASETRISALSRVPASLLGIAEGLAGSSLNAGNFGMARRIFADTWVYTSLQDLSSCLAPMVRVPSDADLWFDTIDIPLLREDGKDAAEIEQVKATTVTSYVREGFTAESAVQAVHRQDITLLVHTGNVSVQLQPPGTQPPGTTPPDGGGGPKPSGPQPKPVESERARAASRFAAEHRTRVHAMRAAGKAAGRAAALATLRRLRGRLSGALRRELDAIIALLASGSGARHTPGGHQHNQQDHAGGRKRTGTLGSVLGKLEALREKLDDNDRAILDSAMRQLRDLESSDVDDDDLIDDEPDEVDEDDDEEASDLVMDSDVGELSFITYTDGDVDIDWDSGSVRLGPAAQREIADAVARFSKMTTVPYPQMPDMPAPDWIKTRDEYIKWSSEQLQAWYESDAFDDYNKIVGEMVTSDGEFKVIRTGGGVTVVGGPVDVDGDNWDEAIQLDDDQSAEFAETLRQATARASADLQQSAQRSQPVSARLDWLAVDVARRRPLPGKGRPGRARPADQHLRHMPGRHPQENHGRKKGAAELLKGDVSKSVATAKPSNQELSDRLAAGIASGVADERRISGENNVNDVDIVQFRDGSRAVRKTSKGEVDDVEGEFDAEELGAQVARVLGLNPPHVRRSGWDQAYYSYVHDGAPKARVGAEVGIDAVDLNGLDARRIGLLDTLIENSDRHNGNWFSEQADDPNARLIPIDHGQGWEGARAGSDELEAPWPPREFQRYLVRGLPNPSTSSVWAENDLSPVYLEGLRPRLEALRPEFERLGRGEWLHRVLTRLSIVTARARGTVTL